MGKRLTSILILPLATSLVACAGWGALTTKDLVPEETVERVKAQKAAANVTPAQRAVFGILADFPGHTFRGEPTGDNPVNVADVQRWEWTDNGEALLIRHALEDGSYGGDTIVRPGEKDGRLAYVYDTNTGFSTEGTFSISDDGTWEAVEDVVGQSDVTKVRSRGHRRADGALISSSDYFKDGEWVAGHGFVYKEVDQDLPELKTPVPK